jgi:hypothetical protein
MQTYFSKKIIISFYCLIFSTLQLKTFSQKSNFSQADLLFKAKNYQKAEIEFEKNSISDKKINKSIFLKRAFIAEKENNYAKALYFLGMYENSSPTRPITKKMEDLVSKSGYKGYERQDIYYTIVYIKEYYTWILLFFILISGYVFGVFVQKWLKGEHLQFKQIAIFLTYNVILLFFINYPLNFSYVIVKNDYAKVRQEASGGSNIVGNLEMGEKLNFYNKTDIWLEVKKEKERVFIKKSDVYLIK